MLLSRCTYVSHANCVMQREKVSKTDLITKPFFVSKTIFHGIGPLLSVNVVRHFQIPSRLGVVRQKVVGILHAPGRASQWQR